MKGGYLQEDFTFYGIILDQSSTYPGNLFRNIFDQVGIKIDPCIENGQKDIDTGFWFYLFDFLVRILECFVFMFPLGDQKVFPKDE